MISEKTKIIFSLSDRFDYSKYTETCIEFNVDPWSENMFYQTAGQIEGAYRLNSVDPELEYIRIATGTVIVGTTKKQGCSSCGGGKVL